MFDNLKPFNKIVVTGPGRSGTTIAAKIIADELGYKFVDEMWFSAALFDMFQVLISHPRRKMVVHAPCLSARIHEVGDRDDVAVILMRRNIKDILESQKHTLTFKKEDIPGQFVRCDEGWKQFRLKQYKLAGSIISEPQVVYNYWDTFQKDKIKNQFELDYEDLRFHPLWIAKPERRKHFTDIKQINYDVDFQNKNRFMFV